MKRLGENGFTLVEALVSLVVTTAVVLILTNFMLGGVQQSSIALGRDNMTKETEQSLDLMTNDIRVSANADENNRWQDPNSPGGSGNQFGWQSNGTTLVLATAAKDKSGNVIFSDPANYITEKNNIVYFVQNGTLYKRVIADPVTGNAAVSTCPAADANSSCPADTELLHNITAFSITYMNGQNQSVTPTDARAIQVHVTVTKDVFKQPVSADYTTRMVFRND